METSLFVSWSSQLVQLLAYKHCLYMQIGGAAFICRAVLAPWAEQHN